MKALDLLRGMSASAKRRLKVVMNSHGRPSLQKLYGFLSTWKNGQPPTKEELHVAAFESPFHPDRDDLLRNELRLLSQEITEVMAIEEFLTKYHGNSAFKELWDLRAEIRMGAAARPSHLSQGFPLGEYAYDQPGHLADGLEAWLKSAIETREIHRSTAEELIAASDHLITLRRAEAGRKLSQALLMQRVAQRWAQMPHSDLADVASLYDLGSILQLDPVAAFLHAQYQAQAVMGRDRIRILEDGLAQLRKCKPSKLMDRETKELGFLAMIGLEWYLQGDYAQANAHYETALGLPTLTRHPQWMSIITNSISSLLKAGDPNRAMSVLQRFAPMLGDQPQAQFLLLGLQAMAHLFLNQASAAIQCIPPDIQQRRGSTYLLFRFVQPIAYLLQDDAEAAEREAHNISKMIRYWQEHDLDRLKELEIDHLQVARWMEQYAQALQMPEKEAQLRKQSLIKAIAEASEAANPLFRDFLPLQWLRKRISMET